MMRNPRLDRSVEIESRARAPARRAKARAASGADRRHVSRQKFPFVFQARVSFNPPLQPAIRNFALLFLGTLLFHIAGSWTLPLIDRDEPRFAEASREMRQRGDYVVPYFNNRYRFDKPPLTYWCQSVSYRVFGANDFAARLPSAIAAALTAVVLLAWGRRVGEERVGWWAALIFSLCLQTFMHARAAVADMWLVFFMTSAHWAGYELLRESLGEKRPTSNVERPTFNEEDASWAQRWWWMFYGALALGFLAKGPIGWMPLLTLGVVRFMVPDLRLARRFHFFAGVSLALLLVALWGIPALWRTEGLFLDVGIGKHVVGRSLVAMEGHGAAKLWSYLATLPFYFVLIFVSFAPWSIKLPWLAQKLWRQRDAVDCYLIAGVAVVFVVFTLVKTKLPHYTLPAIPLLALLLAKALDALPGSRRFVRRTAISGGVVAALALAVTPVVAHFSPTLQLLHAARGDLRREMEIGALDYREPSLVWYFRKYIDGWMVNLSAEALPNFFAKPGGRVAVMSTAIALKAYPILPAGWKSHRAQGLNTATGKWVDLTLIVKPAR